MASTYSDLKIELIGTGEQVGTWGSTTNANLGTAIEEAIVGSADVSFSSSDVTITLTNTNGTQAARHLRLNLTGTSGGARNLILGSGCQIDKPYIINNGLADTVTVKNTTGTGVAVPAGRSMWVYNNGTNVVDVTNHVSSLTLSTPLPLASGGTGASVAATARTNLGLGSLAVINSPLPIANGGTGATTDSNARTNLGLGTIATQNSNNVSITGGSITGITDLTVADGGTGRSTLTANNVILGNGTSAVNFVAPGTSGNVLVSNGTTWTSGVAFVTGMIMLWSGSTASIPSGWALCNGSNGTPDLRDRFVVGAGSTYAVNATGGASTVTLATTNLPSHTHSISGSGTTGLQSANHTHTFGGTTSGQSQSHTHSGTTDSAGTHSHTGSLTQSTKAGTGPTPVVSSTESFGGNYNYTTASAGAHTHTITTGDASQDHNHTYSGTTSGISANHDHTFSFSGTSGAAGSGTAVNILNPYYALAYIMKL